LDERVEIVDDTLVEAVELGSPLGVEPDLTGLRRPACYSACKIDPLSRGIGVQN